MYVYLSKILPVFVMPVSVVLALLLLAVVFLRRGMKKTASGLLGAAFAVLWAASTPLMAERLYGGLEAKFPPPALADPSAADAQ